MTSASPWTYTSEPPSHPLPHGQPRSSIIFIPFPPDITMTYDPEPDLDLILSMTSYDTAITLDPDPMYS